MTQYFYTGSDGLPKGPVTIDELRALHENGSLPHTNRVYDSTTEQWSDLAVVLGLAVATQLTAKGDDSDQPKETAPGDAPPSGWTDTDKGALCFYGGIPIFFIGLISLKNATLLSLFCGPALAACFVGAIRWKYYETDRSPTTVWALLSMAFFSLFITGWAVAMLFFGWVPPDR